MDTPHTPEDSPQRHVAGAEPTVITLDETRGFQAVRVRDDDLCPPELVEALRKVSPYA